MEIVFQFSNLEEILWMEGHGPYVWAAYSLTGIALGVLGLSIRRARKNFLRLQASIISRNTSKSTAANV